MVGLVPAIQVFLQAPKTRMPGTRPGMTVFASAPLNYLDARLPFARESFALGAGSSAACEFWP
jgi:hypothetical protein